MPRNPRLTIALTTAPRGLLPAISAGALGIALALSSGCASSSRADADDQLPAWAKSDARERRCCKPDALEDPWWPWSRVIVLDWPNGDEVACTLERVIVMPRGCDPKAPAPVVVDGQWSGR